MAMSPRLKPLLLPQLVEERKKVDVEVHTTEDDLPYTSYTNNSSSSDIVSPITPTFSAKGHFRGSSSASSLDLAYVQFQDAPSSPVQQLSQQPSKRQLPDVQEEPFEKDEDKTVTPDHFGLYSCLCDEPCDHRKSSEQIYPGDFLTDQDFDYDIDCLSDGETSAAGYSAKHGSGNDSPFLGLTTRFGSRFNTVNRWKSNWKTNLTSPPTTEISFENVLSRGHSSRSSSMSSPSRRVSERPQDPPPPALSSPTMSYYDSVDSIDSLCEKDERTLLDPAAEYERDRAQATTPLLPPLLTSPLAEPPLESPLQSPSIAQSTVTEVRPKPSTTVNYSRPSLSTRPSISSLRNGPCPVEVTLPLSAFLQEHDEWSDRLGHANFTITPQPYELEGVDSDALSKFREDWEAARVNYTKHLVRTGENYGQTSKIYALTEAKWAQTEARWRSIYDGAIKQAMPADAGRQMYTIAGSRSRSRGRGRGRSGSASASIMGRPSNNDSFAEMHWQRIEENLPSAVPRMLDAEGKFPERGDEDIVGPMHRAETMERTPSEEKHGAKFWKNLAGKVGLRR